jgi:hypothetical protein
LGRKDDLDSVANLPQLAVVAIARLRHLAQEDETMALRRFVVERQRVRRRHMLRLLAAASLPLMLAACAGQRSGARDPRLGQSPISRGGRG